MVVEGRNLEANGCATGGFSLSCTAVDSNNKWNEFGTNTEKWLANGAVPCNSSS